MRGRAKRINELNECDIIRRKQCEDSSQLIRLLRWDGSQPTTT